MSYVAGAGRALANRIETHLFVVCPNNSGSTFLAAALADCRAAWHLPTEGQMIRGFAGPVPWRPKANPWIPRLLWASEQRWIDLIADPGGHDWPRTRKAWYWYARARAPDASVFVAKSTHHVLHVAQLAKHFSNARFLFMVRNPYAVCEGICRRYRTRLAEHFRRQFTAPGRSLPATAATHVANFLAWQRRNIEAWRDRSVFFTYEQMCGEPAAVASQIRALVPAIDDLVLNRRIAAKDYDEVLANMNGRQLANLRAEDVAAFNRVFREHRDTLEWFGYELMDPAA